MNCWKRKIVAAAMMLWIVPAPAQLSLSERPSRAVAKPAAVEYLFPEQVSLPAGKPSVIALHFRVAQGLHINSHTPKDEFLIPTTFLIPADSGVKLESASYPQGREFVFSLEPDAKLSVYSGEFVIQARVVAAAGDHLVEAQLRYQACDNNACQPPRTITVALDVIGVGQ